MATLPSMPEGLTLAAAQNDRSAAVTLAVRSFLYAIFKHRRLVFAVFLVVFLGSVVVALFRPTAWLATGKILVKTGSLAQLAPSEAPSREINPPLNQETVKTEADIIHSYVVVDEALHRLNIKPEEGADWADLVDGVQKGLTVTPNPGTNGIDVNFIGRDPKRAARMVNAIADVYIERHNAVYGRNGVRHFYDREARRLEKRMKRSEERLHAFMVKNKVADLDQELHLLNQDVLDQQKELAAHRAKIVSTQRKLDEVDRQLASVPTQVPFTEDYLSNPILQTYKNKVAELEIERVHLLQGFLPTDRHVQDVEDQMEKLRAQMREERDRILNKQTLRANELHTELERNRFSLETLLADERAREVPLAERLEVTQARLTHLRDETFRLENLKQEFEHTKYSYDLYWKKHEEARVTEAMHDQSMVQVSIMDRAVPPLEPLNGILLPLALGIIGGLALATAMAVAVEYLNRRLRFEEEVERYLELPVLAVIPDLESVPDVAHA